MPGSTYDFGILSEIPQIDAKLALKKLGSNDALYRIVSEYVQCADSYIEKYGDNGVVANHKNFLEDTKHLKGVLEKFYATTVIWDVDSLVDAFMAGNRDTITEKCENLEISLEALKSKIMAAELDENGNLRTPPKEKLAPEDEELSSQPECGKTVTGNYLPMDRLKEMAAFVDALDFDEATEIAKKMSAVYYEEELNIEIKKLIWIMRMGEFEKASDIAQNLIELAEKYNRKVEENIVTVKPRVLVVDDVPDMLLTVKGILYELCHVCTVTNHISALRFLENCHADLIMLDILLPEMDGFTLLKQIRKLNAYKKTPVIFLTGDISKDTILKAIDAGISDYLRKPIDAELLTSRVRKHLNV